MASEPKTENDGKTALQEALSRARLGFGVATVMSFVVNFLMLVSPLYMLQTYDRVLTSGSKPTLLYITIIAAIALLVLGIFEALRTAILTRTAAWSARAARDAVASGTLRANLQTPGTTAQPVRDLKQVQTFLSGQGVTPILDSPWTPGFIAIIWIMHPWLGMLGLATAIILAIIGIANELLTRAALKEASQGQVMSYEMLDATLKNAEVIEAMGMRGALLARWRALDDQAAHAAERAAERGGTFTGATKFLRLTAQMAVLGLGAYLVLEGQLTAGGMIAASILLGRALAPLEQLIGAWKGCVSTLLSYRRVQQLLRKLPEETETFELPEPTGRLAVRGLTFRPDPKAAPVLSNINFDITPGECLGVIGASAAGKTTLCRLVTGVYQPTLGEVRIDDAELKFWQRDVIGRHIGYLPQTVELFSATIAENIARMGQPDPQQVLQAAQLANVHEMILHLKDGYDTRVEPGGQGLSAGQRQRIGLARALYGDPKLVVLDEPNSNLDTAGEDALQNAIIALKKANRSVLIVAHRREALANTDKLLVIRNNTVAGYGPSEEIFRQLAEEFSAKRAKPKVVAGGDA
ncbi:MAG: type I secretion system permease/ATPase [Pseudomonadota bacterium]